MDYDTLHALYVEQNLTTREIGRQFGVDHKVVLRALKRHGIPRRKAAPRNNTRERNPNWRGGQYINGNQYRMLLAPEHPHASYGYVPEHIVVALERAQRERLAPDECVHHINLNKLDNRPDNLHICTRAQHTEYHARLEQLTATLLEEGIVVFDPACGYMLKAG